MLAARLWIAIFPFGDAAYRVNFLSAIFAAGAVWALYALVRHLAGPTPAACAAAIFAVQAVPWSQAGVAEVNSLNTLLVGLAFLATVKWSDGKWPLWVAALAAGLAISHHRTALLYAPLLAAFALIAWRRGRSTRTGGWGRVGAALLFFLPFASYLYLPLRASVTPGYPNSWEGFVEHVTGESALPTILRTLGGPLLPRFRLVLLEQAFRGPTGWALLALGLFGVVALLLAVLRRRQGGRPSSESASSAPIYRNMLAFALCCAAFVLGVVFAALYDIVDIVDYLGVPLFMWCVMAGAGIAALLALARQAALANGLKAWHAQTALSLALAGLVLLTAAESLARHDVTVDYSKLDRRAEWSALKPALDSALPYSIAIADWTRFNEALYLESVEGWRPNVTLVQVNDLRTGDFGLIDAWLSEERTVYLLGAYHEVLSRFDVAPTGPIYTVGGRKSQQGMPPMAHTLNRRYGSSILLLGYTPQPDPLEVAPGGTLRVTFYWQATERIFERFTVFTHVIDGAGKMIGQKDGEPGQGFNPTITWQPGEIFAETFEIPIDVAAPPGEYRLIAGLYSSVEGKRLPAISGDEQPLGDYPELARVVVR